MRSPVIFFSLPLALASCSLKNTHMFGSEQAAAGTQAVISSVGIYNGGNLGIQVTSINGNPVDMMKTASFMVPAGTYQVSLHANKDLRITSGYAGGLGVRKEVADGDVSLNVQAGHTYIPNALVRDNRIQFFFEDKGENYPTECLPLYVAVNNSSNPGHKLYRTEKRCEI